MKIKTEIVRSVTVIRCQGRFVGEKASESFEQHTNALLDARSQDCLVDLTPTDYIDSLAWMTLAAFWKRLRETGGRLKLLTQPSGAVPDQLVFICEPIFERYHDEEKAIASLLE